MQYYLNSPSLSVIVTLVVIGLVGDTLGSVEVKSTKNNSLSSQISSSSIGMLTHSIWFVLLDVNVRSSDTDV